MPWSAGDYPSSMKNLDPEVRRKAISIANEVLKSTGDEGEAIATGIARAKEQAPKKGTYRADLLRLATLDDEETQQTQSAIPPGSGAFAGALTAGDVQVEDREDPTLLIKGFGVMTRSQIQAGLKERIGQLNAAATKDDWRTVNYFLTNGVIKAMVEALQKHANTGIWYDSDAGVPKKLTQPPEEF